MGRKSKVMGRKNRRIRVSWNVWKRGLEKRKGNVGENIGKWGKGKVKDGQRRGNIPTILC